MLWCQRVACVRVRGHALEQWTEYQEVYLLRRRLLALILALPLLALARLSLGCLGGFLLRSIGCFATFITSVSPGEGAVGDLSMQQVVLWP